LRVGCKGRFFLPKWEKVSGNCIIGGSMDCTTHPIYLSNKMEENVIGRVCAIYGELWWGNVKEGEHFEDLGTNRRKYCDFLRIHMDKVNMRAV
jgi:hypothetical protein